MSNYISSSLLTVCLFCLAQQLNAQTYVYQTFKDTRIINTYSIETLQPRQLDIRIGHRFGNLINNWDLQNTWASFLGFENAADVAIGAEYGLMQNFTIGLHRTKGAGPLRQLVHGVAKYKVLSQKNDNSVPLSLSIAGTASMATMPSISNTALVSSFPKGFAHRLSYAVQVLAARKFGDNFSLQVSPAFVWRNLVQYDEDNYSLNVGLGGKYQVNKFFAVIFDATLPLDGNRWNNDGKPSAKAYYIPLGFGFEFDTGGHVFQINFTNSSGIEPTDYIPYSSSNWLDGQFRIGFTISRAFRL